MPIPFIISCHQSVAEKFAEDLDIGVKLLQGGNLGSKIKNPSAQVSDLIVTTVNVMSTLFKLQVYSTKKVGHIVLDEADSLLDDSFSETVLNFLHPFSVITLTSSLNDIIFNYLQQMSYNLVLNGSNSKYELLMWHIVIKMLIYPLFCLFNI